MADAVQQEMSVCLSPACGAVSEGRLTHCPECGARANPQSHMRVLGWIMASCGVLILALMAVVCWYTLPLIAGGGEEVDGAAFNGSGADAIFVLGVFAVTVGAGAAGLIAGVSQARTGRRNLGAFRSFLVCAGVLFAIGMLIRRGLIE